MARVDETITEGTLVRPEGAPSLPPRVSWGAVFAGAVVAVAIGLMLNALGAGVAATMVDATQRETPSASAFGIGGAIWLLVSNLIGLAVGAFAQHATLPPEWRLFVITGFLGGLTTFSTFSAEIVGLLQQGRLSWAAGAITAHVAGSLIATLAGLATWEMVRRAG